MSWKKSNEQQHRRKRKNNDDFQKRNSILNKNGKTYVSDWLHNSHCHILYIGNVMIVCVASYKFNRTNNKEKLPNYSIQHWVQCVFRWRSIHLSHVHLMDLDWCASFVKRHRVQYFWCLFHPMIPFKCIFAFFFF